MSTNPTTRTVAPSPLSQEAASHHRPLRPSRRRRNPWPARLIVLVLLAAGMVAAVRSSKRKPLAVELVRVERATVRDEVSSPSAGVVMAERDATVTAEAVGRVVAVRHQRGERVKAGEVLVSLDAAEPSSRLRQAQATVDAQRAVVSEAEARAAAATRVAERFKRLSERGAETSSSAEDSAATARQAEAAALAAKGQLEQSVAALQVARVGRSHTDITAPFDGVVSDIPVVVGDALQVGGTVFELIDDSRLHVEAALDEADVGRVKLGQPAALRLDALPGHPVLGRVTRLDPTLRKDEKGVRTLRIEIEVSDLPGATQAGLKPGMSANVDVRVDEKENVLSLPSSVIIGRGTQRSVYRVENGVARETPVQIGLSSWDRTELTGGLSEGEEVICTLNVKGLTDGVPVTTKGAVAR